MISPADREVLRPLAAAWMDAAADPVNAERAAAWRRLNDLEEQPPLVWINEIPWPEMDVDGELILLCAGDFAREVERRLRRTIYQWRHLPADMIVEPVFRLPLVIHDSGFGITVEEEAIRQEGDHISSHRYVSQIDDPADVDKIRDPVVRVDREASAARHGALTDAIGDLLPVESTGVIHRWFAPWDVLVQWCDVQQILMDLALRPELVHAAMARLTEAHLARLRQWEEQNLLAYAPGDYRVGSGGLAYTAGLPAPGFDPERVRTADQWGCCATQIFSEVSPAMHEEFALDYELRWLERFGANYWGCCEQLHDKIHLARRIPRLRKISVSPQADVARAAERIGGDYVLSLKPNPAVLAGDRWNPAAARADLERSLERAAGCAVEIIMKDISTVRGEPWRLWEWSALAKEAVAARLRRSVDPKSGSSTASSDHPPQSLFL